MVGDQVWTGGIAFPTRGSRREWNLTISCSRCGPYLTKRGRSCPSSLRCHDNARFEVEQLIYPLSSLVSLFLNISWNIWWFTWRVSSLQGHSKLSTRFVLNVYSSRSFLLHQLPCSFIGLKQREMEMEEGSAHVSWYESQLRIGPNNFLHWLVCTGVDSGRFGLVLVE